MALRTFLAVLAAGAFLRVGAQETLSSVQRELLKDAPDLAEARRLCVDTAETCQWKVETWEYPENGRACLIGRALFYTRGAAEDFARGSDNRTRVAKTQAGDQEFA